MADGRGVDVIEKKEARKVPSHESVERAWASNDKLTYDNTLTHCKNLMNFSEMGIANALSFQEKINNEYLAREQQLRENNRFTLNYLYGVYPEEATGFLLWLKELNAQKKAETK